MSSILTIDPREYRSPLSDVDTRTEGSARLHRATYSRGLYAANGVRGYEYYRINRPLPVVSLQQRDGRRWKTWMVDDPVHLYGMQEAVDDLPTGRVLVAGLGLGLFLHHMYASARHASIVVVERNADVVRLIAPTLPPDLRASIVVDDFYAYIARTTETFDAVLWDLAVGNPAETLAPMIHAVINVRQHLGDVPLRIFGLRRGVALNPDAVLLTGVSLRGVVRAEVGS